jgi:hypothetical protein
MYRALKKKLLQNSKIKGEKISLGKEKKIKGL